VRGAGYRRTDVVSKGVAPTTSLVDPRPIHIVALVVLEIFLGMSNSGWEMCVEETLPNSVPEVQESKMAVSAEPLGRPLTNKFLSF